eukprot:51823-Rhodomonas_salina.1
MMNQISYRGICSGSILRKDLSNARRTFQRPLSISDSSTVTATPFDMMSNLKEHSTRSVVVAWRVSVTRVSGRYTIVLVTRIRAL